MNIDLSSDANKKVAVGPGNASGSLFTIEKPSTGGGGIPLAGRPATQPVRPPPAMPPPPPRAPPATRASDAHDMLHDFANPVKEGTAGVFGGSETDSLTDGNDSLTDGSDDKSVSEYVMDERQDTEDLPSTGFVSIDDEKSHILWKLSRAKRSGMPVHRNLTIDSNIRELRNELKRVEYELGLSQSLRFQKRMLCLAVSGMEVLTERYSLFDLQLQGWSSQVQDDIDSFDGVLSRIYEKYADRASMPPELQLLLMLVSSAISFHVTKSMMKSISQPGGGGLGGLLQSMMGAKAPQQSSTKVQEMPPPDTRPPQTFQRAPMRGPSMAPAMPFGAPPEPMNPPQMSNDPRPGEKRARDDASDRASDLVSDSDQSGGSADPSGSDDSSSSDDGELQIKTVAGTAGRGRGRGRGGGRGGRGSKTVVTF
jgi:hypothetical protein